MFPNICLQRFLLEGCCKCNLDTFKAIQRFGFENMIKNGGKINPLLLGNTVTVEHFHSNMAIDAGTGAYEVQ